MNNADEYVMIVKQQAQNHRSSIPQFIFQDPAFCTTDHRLLNGLGGQVLEDPMAFACIDQHTLVFAKHIPLVVYFNSLLMTSPAVCVSTVSSLCPLHSNITRKD